MLKGDGGRRPGLLDFVKKSQKEILLAWAYQTQDIQIWE
ncbi:MAG: hypothetical protein CM15mP49_06130 [Actinomycetota bacterium]|nr:MAG: hypothetical protein CM15mP49_06130 [Actinomycetota bacterium]